MCKPYTVRLIDMAWSDAAYTAADCVMFFLQLRGCARGMSVGVCVCVVCVCVCVCVYVCVCVCVCVCVSVRPVLMRWHVRQYTTDRMRLCLSSAGSGAWHVCRVRGAVVQPNPCKPANTAHRPGTHTDTDADIHT